MTTSAVRQRSDTRGGYIHVRSSGSTRFTARRRLVALTAATALAAGTATALAPAASADATGWTATDGAIAVVNDGIVLVDAEGVGDTYATRGSDDEAPAWAPDGSRIVFEQAGTLRTVSVAGGASTKVYDGTENGRSASHPTYWASGSRIVFAAAKKLYSVPSGGGSATALLSSGGGCDTHPSASVDSVVVFQRNGSACTTKTPSIVRYDASAGTQTTLVTNAAAPALSPDGTKLAFIRSVDGHHQLFSINTDGTGERRLTEDTADYDSPSWAPASDRMVVHFDHGTTETGGCCTTGNAVLTITADAVTRGATFPYGGRSPAWQPLRKNGVGRVWGADVCGSNIAASRWTWNTVGQSEAGLKNASAAVLVSKDSQAYALTAAALAGKKGGPVLLTSATSVTSAVQSELKRVLKPGATVYLLGGSSVLGNSVSTKVTALGFKPKRLAGTSRYSTSVAVAKSITSAPTDVFLSTGTDYHSALAAASAAGALGKSGKAVVVLNEGNKLTASVKSYLNGLDPRDTHIIPVGGSAKYALTHTTFSKWPSTYSYYPVTGSTHEATAAALAKFWWGGPRNAALAYVDSWRGGVSAASAMNVYGPLLWTKADTLSTDTKAYLVKGAASLDYLAVFGGTGSVSTGALNSAGAAISASGGQWGYTPYYNGLEPATSSFSAPLVAGSGLTALRTTATR